MIRPQLFWLGTGIALIACLIGVTPAKAQAGLVSASPAPDAVLEASPQSIELTFDHLLSTQATSITLTSEDGTFSFTEPVTIDPTNRFHASLQLPSLVQGTYRVSYSVKGIGRSTLKVGSYTFSIVPLAPVLELVTPVNGQAFALDEPILLDMRVQGFEFGFFDNRIRIYVDNQLHGEIQATTYQIDGLAPGVHEIRTVLAQLDDSEFPDTTTAITIAVAQPDPELEGRAQAAIAAPDPGLTLTPLQIAGVVVLTAILVGIGLMLGRTTQA